MNTEARAISKPAAETTGPVHSLFQRSGIKIAAVLCLLLMLEFQLLYSVKQESLTFDEGDHIFSGYMSLKHHDFGLNPEHPPLVKMIAAIPLLGMNLHEPQLQNRYFKNEAYLSGRDFIFQNDYDKVIFRARMAASIFALLTALLAFLMAREMFGTGAGFIALVLIVFEPNFLAHGALVTTDTGAAAGLLASIYAFYRYVKSPSWGRVVVLGLAAGLFFIVKHSAVLLPAMLILLAVTELLRPRQAGARDPLAPGDTPGGCDCDCRSDRRRRHVGVLRIPLRRPSRWRAVESTIGEHAREPASGGSKNDHGDGALESAARVLALRSGRRAIGSEYLAQLHVREGLCAWGVVLFSGGVPH